MSEVEWTPWDTTTLCLYFALLIAIGLFASTSNEKESNEEYFLARKSMKWWTIAASLFASNIGAEHFVGLSGEAAFSGIAVAWLVIFLALYDSTCFTIDFGAEIAGTNGEVFCACCCLVVSSCRFIYAPVSLRYQSG